MVRVTVHTDGIFVQEHLYNTDLHSIALRKFLKDFPKFKSSRCICNTETYDENDIKNIEHYKACINCGCVD
jgi:hypothetical protein